MIVEELTEKVLEASTRAQRRVAQSRGAVQPAASSGVVQPAHDDGAESAVSRAEQLVDEGGDALAGAVGAARSGEEEAGEDEDGSVTAPPGKRLRIAEEQRSKRKAGHA